MCDGKNRIAWGEGLIEIFSSIDLLSDLSTCGEKMGTQ